MAEEFYLESYRYEHESSTEWNLRKHFLDSHHDKFTKNRLVSLSNCYINVELYGCSYPDELMIQLATLIEDLEGLQDHRDQVKERNEVKFVKASDGTGGDNGQSPARKNKDESGISFVKSIDKYSTCDNPTNSSDNNKPSTSKDGVIPHVNDKSSQFYSLASCMRDLLQDMNRFKGNYIPMVMFGCKRAQMTINTEFLNLVNGEVKCEVFIDGVFIASKIHSYKRMAKKEAFELALKLLLKPYIQVLSISTGRFELNTSDSPLDGGESNLKNTYNPTSPVHNDRFELNTSDSPLDGGESNLKNTYNPSSPVHNNILDTAGDFTKLGSSPQGNINSLARGVAKKRQAPPDISPELTSFILVEPLVLNNGQNSLTILTQSASFNNVSVNYVTRVVGRLAKTVLLIGDEIVSKSSLTGKNGKKDSADKALNLLRETNWTLICKSVRDVNCKSGISITKDDVLQDNKLHAAIPDSNVGSKLLKMMGWTGGGLGAEGRKGIAEPVSVEGVKRNRSGIGLKAQQGISRDFHKRIKKLLEDYKRSNDPDDIYFDHGFQKEERAIIHRLAQNMRLKTKSYDTGSGERFVTVSKVKEQTDIIQQVASHGGETEKYRLIPPGKYGQALPERSVDWGEDNVGEEEEGEEEEGEEGEEEEEADVVIEEEEEVEDE